MVSVVEVRVITVASAHQDSTGIWAPSTSSPIFFMPSDFAFDAGEALHQRDVAERVGGAFGHVAVVALDRCSAASRSCADDQRDQHREDARTARSAAAP